MDATEITPDSSSQLATEFREALDDLARGVRRPEKMRAACDRMDRMREENRVLFGEQAAAVNLVREARDCG